MTLEEFNTAAVAIVKEFGMNGVSVNVMCGILNGKTFYSCTKHYQLKTIESGHQNNPTAALNAFRDAIEYRLKSYNSRVDNITID